MKIIRQRSAQPDRWPAAASADQQELARHLADSSRTHLLVELDVWQQHQSMLVDALSSGNLAVGVQMTTEYDVGLLDQSIRPLSLIRIVFAGFNDGRGFSIANILRDQLGYTGELRAANVVKENLAMLEQCGFDSFELAEGSDIDKAITLFDQLKPVAA